MQMATIKIRASSSFVVVSLLGAYEESASSYQN
jgi:hypothetical protein